MKPQYLHLFVLALCFTLLAGCNPDVPEPEAVVAQRPLPTATTPHNPSITPTATLPTHHAAVKPPSSPTPLPTTTSTPSPPPSPTPTVTATPTASPTPIGPCDERMPPDGLLVLVTLDYGLSRAYVPTGLVELSDYLPLSVTMGYPTELRSIAAEPLAQMIDEMLAEGLQPTIISGYRSYSTQALAWNKWQQQQPDRAAIISAHPGHSEHQLGTTVDFGTPELVKIVGQEDIQFHTYFYQTAVGQWLLDNAYRFGFTLSYPREAFELTGFYYEPWHYRYVGVELATELHEQGRFLAEYLLDTRPIPCLP